MKTAILNLFAWSLIIIGIVLSVFPFFYNQIGALSGLLAFAILFVGISLLKLRKDQLNK